MDVSVLGSLASLCSASLALNLAYLNLDQFRYRNTMAALAEDRLQYAPATVRSTTWYCEIESLSRQGKKDQPKLKLPRGAFWSHVYRTLFHWQVDKSVSIGLTVISAAYLFLGVAHEVGMFPETQSAFTKAEISNELIYASAGVAWPMLMVLSAKFCVGRCTAFVKYQLDNITRNELESGQADVDAASAGLDQNAEVVETDKTE